jgi:glycosyltransferase involved in cell wall biosynthesis
MKCSIITAVFNRRETILRVLKSVQSQTYHDLQHVVIDGCSTDGTVEIISDAIRNKDIFISEEDLGIYDALNTGIKLSTGEVIALLHSDDVYSDNFIVERAMTAMESGGFDIVYGDVSFFRASDFYKDVRLYKSGVFSKSRLSWGWMPAHPAIFIKKTIYDKFGLFRTDYKIAADFEYLCRLASDPSIYKKYIPEVFVRMQMGGVSTSGIKNTVTLNKEVLRACRENGIDTNLFKILSKYPLKISEKCPLKKYY